MPTHRHVDCIPEDENEPDQAMDRVLVDKGRNMYGTEIKQLAVMGGMQIINGTCLDGTRGSHTCFAHPAHPTTVDLSLISTEDTDLVQSLATLSYFPDLSDHCPQSLHTTITRRPEGSDYNTDEGGVSVELTKAHWNAENKQAVTRYLQQNSVTTQCATILAKMSNQRRTRAVDVAVSEINEILVAAMTGNCEVTFHKVPNKRSCTKKNPDQPWFDDECNASMETLRHVSNQYKGSGHPLPPKYYGMSQAHQRLLSRKEARHRTKILDLMTQSCGVDPHKWWSLLKQLNPATDMPFVPKEISASNWATHFKTLLNDPPKPSTGPHATVTATEILQMARANIKGNQPITLAEVTKIVNNLRKNKAMYFDRVPNEMIQILHEAQPTVLPILFNHILQTGLFPTEWSQAYLRPLYKKGNKL